MTMIPLLLALLLAGCAATPVWREYDAGVAKVWIGELRDVDRVCRKRAQGAFDQRRDQIRGCADFCRKEILSIADPGVLVHEGAHLAMNSYQEMPTCAINTPGTTPEE
jgi:hypothetical protein